MLLTIISFFCIASYSMSPVKFLLYSPWLNPSQHSMTKYQQKNSSLSAFRVIFIDWIWVYKFFINSLLASRNKISCCDDFWCFFKVGSNCLCSSFAMYLWLFLFVLQIMRSHIMIIIKTTLITLKPIQDQKVHLII